MHNGHLSLEGFLEFLHPTLYEIYPWLFKFVHIFYVVAVDVWALKGTVHPKIYIVNIYSPSC